MTMASELYVVTFAPTPIHAGDPVTAFVTDAGSSPCLPPATSVSLTTQAVTLRLDFTDVCAGGGRIQNRAYDLGALPAGSYTFQINACQDNPPPLPSPCSIVYSAPLMVAGLTDTVPMSDAAGLIALCASLLISAASRLRCVVGSVAWARESRQQAA